MPMTEVDQAKTQPVHLAATDDRRREPRYPHSFSIEVSGFDHAGRFFTERTSTLDASMCGCRFNLRTAVERGSVVAIRLLHAEIRSALDRPTVLFQVAHTQQSGRGWIVGVWKLQSSRAWSSQFEQPSIETNAST
jgi:PilZ domain